MQDVCFFYGLATGLVAALGVGVVYSRHYFRQRRIYQERITQSVQLARDLLKANEDLRAKMKEYESTQPRSANSGERPWKLDVAYCGPRGYAG